VPAGVRVEDSLACGDTADCVGELPSRRVLRQKPSNAALEGAQQVAGLAEAGEDEALAGGQRMLKPLGGGQSVEAGQVDVEDGYVGAHLQRDRLDQVSAFQFGHDFHVVLETNQGDERSANQVHVLGHEHPDHVATSTRSVKRPASAWVRTCPPTARRRSVMPMSPEPAGPVLGRGRSLVASNQMASGPRPALTVQCWASLCRRTLVAASRTTQPRAESTAAGRAPNSPSR